MSNNPLVPIALNDMERMSVAVAKSNLFGMKTPEQALALMFIAQAEGVHPAIAVRDYHIIQGRPALKADAMLARFQAAGGRVKWLSYTDEKVEGEFSHPQGGTVTVDWTRTRAAAAGLANKDNWKSYPRQMLRSRVISEGVRAVFPGANSGMYTVEEVQDMDPKDVTPPSAEPEPVPASPTALTPEETADHLAAIEAAADLADLERAWKTANSHAKMAGDLLAHNTFKSATEKKRLTLIEAAA